MTILSGIQVVAATRALLVAGTLLGAAAFPDAAARAGALPGGRLLAAGPFLFYATLYADPHLQPPAKAAAAWLASDVPGVGARLLWQYRGRGLLGPVTERYAPLGATGCVGATYTALHAGDRGGREGGGLLLPAGARPGRRAGYALDVATPRGDYGVVIRYTVRSGPHGLTPSRVVVAPSRGHTVPTIC